VNTWDAKLLAAILLRQHTVAGLPGTEALSTRVTRPASAQNVLFLLEEPTMLKDRMAAALQVILPCVSVHVAETTNGMIPDA
jgi:hypothetical protein